MLHKLFKKLQIYRKCVDSIVIQTGEGGLCDRLRAISFALYFRERFSCPLTVEWPLKGRQCDIAFEELFVVPKGIRIRDGGTGSGSVCFNFSRRGNGALPQSLLESLTPIEKAQEEEFSLPIYGVYSLKGDAVSFPRDILHFSGMNWAPWYQKIRPIPELETQINQWAKDYRIDSGVVGIHFRGTDVRVRDALEFPERLPRLINQIRLLRRSDPNQRFFICSDEKISRDTLLDAAEGAALALPIEFVNVTEKPAGRLLVRRPAKNVLDAVVELWLLARTNYNDRIPLEMHYSSFTRQPVWLQGRIPLGTGALLQKLLS